MPQPVCQCFVILGSEEVEVSLLKRLEVARSGPALTLCPIYNSDESLEVGDSPNTH